MQQRSHAWYQARLGRVTASRVFDICDKTKKGEYTAKREAYMYELLAERETGIPTDTYIDRNMQWGIDHEDEAADWFLRPEVGATALNHSFALEMAGFEYHPTIQMAGASPDRIIRDFPSLMAWMLLEIKCLKTVNHLSILKSKEIPEKFKYQMAWQLCCTGLKKCWFMSFDPRVKDDAKKACIILYEPSQNFLDEVTAEVVKFLGELDELQRSL
jgi:exodeoxyribonuclease (lambda-induced)